MKNLTQELYLKMKMYENETFTHVWIKEFCPFCTIFHKGSLYEPKKRLLNLRTPFDCHVALAGASAHRPLSITKNLSQLMYSLYYSICLKMQIWSIFHEWEKLWLRGWDTFNICWVCAAWISLHFTEFCMIYDYNNFTNSLLT